MMLAFAALGAVAAGQQTTTTALGALKLLPKGQAKLVARVEARDGTPTPERWHILVHDKDAQNGLKEYVVAGHELVASRGLSQFAEMLKPDDVIGDGLKVDSDRVAKLAQDFANANKVTVASLNYELHKDGAEAVPLWKVTCVDETGKEVGSIVVSAGKGNVVAHDGFPVEPAPAEAKQKEKEKDKLPPAPPNQVAELHPDFPPITPVPAPQERPNLFKRIFRGR